jgi:ribulose-phosphate 3-epimerase
MNIYPTILTDSLTTLREQLELSKSLPQVEIVQIDIIDGFFADNLTITALDLADENFDDLKCDLHLMVDEPMDFVLEAEAIKNQVPIRAMIAQIEHMTSQQAYLEEVKAHQWQVGLSLNIDTPLESIESGVWENLDMVQLMGNTAGIQGQNLDPRIFDKISRLHQKIQTEVKKEIEIIIDIGVKLENAAQLVRAGADSLAIGSLIWRATDPPAIIEQLFMSIES